MAPTWPSGGRGWLRLTADHYRVRDVCSTSAPIAARWSAKACWIRASFLWSAQQAVGSIPAALNMARCARRAGAPDRRGRLQEGRAQAGHALVTVSVLTGVLGGAPGFA